MVDRLYAREDFHCRAQTVIFQDCLNSVAVDPGKVARYVNQTVKLGLEALCKVEPHALFFATNVSRLKRKKNQLITKQITL